jgi:hypothetical protein
MDRTSVLTVGKSCTDSVVKQYQVKGMGSSDDVAVDKRRLLFFDLALLQLLLNLELLLNLSKGILASSPLSSPPIKFAYHVVNSSSPTTKGLVPPSKKPKQHLVAVAAAPVNRRAVENKSLMGRNAVGNDNGSWQAVKAKKKPVVVVASSSAYIKPYERAFGSSRDRRNAKDN